MRSKQFISMALALMMALSVQVMISPLPVSAAADMTRYGLRGDYWLCDNLQFTQYISTAIDPNINNTNTHGVLLERAGRQEYVAVRWTGWVQCPGVGEKTVTVQTSTDDSCRVWINNTKVVDWWSAAWDDPNVWGHNLATVTLTGGEWYPFTMEYCQGYGGAFARIRWTTAGEGEGNVTNQIIPAENFRLDTDFVSPATITAIDASGMVEGSLNLTVQDFTAATTMMLYSASDKFFQDPLDTVVNPMVVDGKIAYILPDGLKAGGYYFATEQDGVRTKGPNFAYINTGVTPRPEYPRPDYARDEAWETLNGPWDFILNRSGLSEVGWENGLPETKATIMVPFPWQSAQSGIFDTTHPATSGNQSAWYYRTFMPSAEKYANQRLVLRFGAVDANCTVYVNGEAVGSHVGGYTPFEFDITDKVTMDAENDIALRVVDGANWGNDSAFAALVGKQGPNAPVGYTATSGIWQSVILEGRKSATQLEYVHIDPLVNRGAAVVDEEKNDLTHGVVPIDGQAKIKVKIVNGAGKTLGLNYNFEAKLWNDDAGAYVPSKGASAITGVQQIVVPEGDNAYLVDFTVEVPNQQLWSPDEPNLYVGTVNLAEGEIILDNVKMHYGQRSIQNAFWATSPTTGTQRYQYTLLNNKPIFMSGLLDQGFWEDGIYTAPSEDALKFDVKEMRANGFNMIRKHIKIEDPLQYFWADRLGMMFWQDMPQATQMGNNGAGRTIYENSLDDMISRDYNSPSRIAYILFNETWGITRNANYAAWIISLYNRCKTNDPSGRLVEDMSPCNFDHLWPTDINSFHMYPGSWSGARNEFLNHYNGAYIGSTYNYSQYGSATTIYWQHGEPFYNSEYGGVASGGGDNDISWCFKYQTDLQRLNQKLQGYVYTEPFDVEYERNGFLRYDRSRKAMGYDEVAYGGDMSPAYLNGQEFVGVDGNPMVTVAPGGTYSSTFGMIRWTDDTKYQGPFTLKWRVDGLDQFGNKIDTSAYADMGFRGEQAITYAPYLYETVPFSFTVPAASSFSKLAGTVTVWIEDGQGKTVTKNFVNFKVQAGTAADAESLGGDAYVLRQSAPVSNTNTGTAAGEKTGAITYEYAIPDDFNIDGLTSLRLYAELAAVQKLSTNGNANHRPQTAENYETPSNITVAVNGIVVSGDVFLPDGPNDIRAIMNLNANNASTSPAGSANGGFGYLVNIDLESGVVAMLKEQLKEDPVLTVVYDVPVDAVNKNGVRAYPETAGRYPMNPSVVLNAPELYYKEGAATDGALVFDAPLPSSNYTVEAKVTGTEAAVESGADSYAVALEGRVLSVTLGDTAIASAVSDMAVEKLRVTFFDEEVRIYVNDYPQPIIDVYGDAFAGTDVAVSGALADVKVMPDTFEVEMEESMTLTSAVSGDRVVARLDNVAVDDKPVVLAAAVYDENGKLVYSELDDTLISARNRTLLKTFVFARSDYEGLDVKVFVWDGETYAPLTPASVPPIAIVSVTSNATTPDNERVENLVDNDTSTKMYTGTGLPINVIVEYSEPVTVDSFRIGTANDYNQRDPRIFTVAGSDDGVNFTELYAHSGNLSTTRFALRTFNLSEPATYKYYRLQITAVRTSGNGCQLSEFNVIGDFNRSDF